MNFEDHALDVASELSARLKTIREIVSRAGFSDKQRIDGIMHILGNSSEYGPTMGTVRDENGKDITAETYGLSDEGLMPREYYCEANGYRALSEYTFMILDKDGNGTGSYVIPRMAETK